MAVNNIEVEGARMLNELGGRFGLEPGDFLATIDISPGGESSIGFRNQQITFHGLTFAGNLNEKSESYISMLRYLGVAKEKARMPDVTLDLNENRNVLYVLKEALESAPAKSKTWSKD